MELTAENVHATFVKCLYKTIPEDQSEAVIVEGLVQKFGFDPVGLELQKENIIKLLLQLPDMFMRSIGGGWSFLNACVTKDEIPWGEHRNMEQLFCMGMGIRKVMCPTPRDVWKVLPGGMPYYVVFDVEGEYFDPTVDPAIYAKEMIKSRSKEE